MEPPVLRTLLVEDDRLDAERVQRLVAEARERGEVRVRLEHVDTLARARERLAEARPDAVLLDLDLPDSRGVETVARLRERAPEVPVVVFLPGRDERTTVGILRAGAQECLGKDELESVRVLLRVLCCAVVRSQLSEQSRRLSERAARDERMASLGVLSGGLAASFTRLLGRVLDEADSALERPDLGAARGGAGAALERIRGTALQAARIAEQLRDYACEGRSRDSRALDLSSFVIACGSSLEPVAGDAPLHYDLEPEGTRVRATPLQLYQVLVALVRNASEASRSTKGSVHVGAGELEAGPELLEASLGHPALRPGPCAFLRVADRGPGIDPELRERIFDPFFSTKATGRGLGLAATLGAVRELGGRIHVDADPGRGARFTVLLPLAASRRDAERPPAPLRARPPADAGSRDRSGDAGA